MVIIVTAMAAVLFAIGLMTALSRLLSRPAPGAAPVDPVITAAPAATAPAVPKIKAILYFASEDGLQLVPTEREVPLAEGAVAQARSILEAQLSAEAAGAAGIDHSERRGAARHLRFRAQRSVRRSRSGHSHGASPVARLQELMTVYTIVNAVLTNLPDLQEVQILIGGQEADTLAGTCRLAPPAQEE